MALRPPASRMAGATSTAASSIATRTYQCSLYGELPHKSLGRLLERLVGLCGDPSSQMVDIHTMDHETQNIDHSYTGLKQLIEHEICFVPSVETPFGPARNDDVVLRLQSNVISDDKNDYIPFSQRQWSLWLLSPPEPPKSGQRLANHRVVYRAPLHGDAIRYVEMLGYRFHFEYVRKGFVFYADQIRIEIYRVYKIHEKHRVQTAEPLVISDKKDMEALSSKSATWIVQATAPLVPQDRVALASEDLFAFASRISGIVPLVIVDHASLVNKIRYTK